MITIRCAHGDTVTYPLADIQIGIGDEDFTYSGLLCILLTKGGGNFVTILLPQLVFIGLLGLWGVCDFSGD